MTTRTLFAVAFASVVALPASAAVLSFDGIDDTCTFDCSFAEDGFTVTGAGGDFGGAGSNALHVDLAAGPYASEYRIARTGGGQFSSSELSIFDITYVGDEAWDFADDEVRITGFLDGAVVAEQDATNRQSNGTVLLSSGFGRIDGLSVAGLLSAEAIDYFDQFGFDIHFEVDDIVVNALDDAMPAAVPVPPAMAGALGALLLLVGLRRRRAA